MWGCVCIYVVGFMRVTYCFGCSGWLGVWVVGVRHSIHTFDYRRNVHSYIVVVGGWVYFDWGYMVWEVDVLLGIDWIC